MKTILFFFAATLALPCLGQQTQSRPEINVIYGDHHVFTVETPEGWINDKQAASTIDLVSFFYSKNDSAKKEKSYIYAMGYDKRSNEDNLNAFVEADLKTFRKKHPDFTFKIIRVKPSGEILNAAMYSFENLSERYKEEVLYMETAYSILVFSFAAFTKQEYISYQPVFDKFIASFNYRGNDPKPYLDWQKSRK
jgi:hypothetical protein